ncbi:hypothetical protein [Clostridium sp. YIM B02551]|uniref:hypothetical protein n=1 Tax=Clostridium sp. YIM B02551 TaxID=2910679 RepID=UPI001EEA9F14|nr:hypothetical protein [Clostridium sp. YIM B02551]
MEKVDMYAVYENWKRGLDRFRWQLISTPFASSKEFVEELDLSESIMKKSMSKIIPVSILELIKEQKENQVLLIDLKGEDNLDLALELNVNFGIIPVLVFAHIFHKKAIVGSKELLIKLIKYSYEIKNIENKYALLLDYNRFSDKEFSKREYFNNQYRLTEEEMPYSEDLNQWGINEVIIVSESPMKIDLKEYVEYLENNNIKVKVNLIN